MLIIISRWGFIAFWLEYNQKPWRWCSLYLGHLRRQDKCISSTLYVSEIWCGFNRNSRRKNITDLDKIIVLSRHDKIQFRNELSIRKEVGHTEDL